jgi:hypothetical protein
MFPSPPNKHMQRAGLHKAPDRSLSGQPAGADVNRWASLMLAHVQRQDS